MKLMAKRSINIFIFKFTNINQNERWIIYYRYMLTGLGRKNWRGGFKNIPLNFRGLYGYTNVNFPDETIL